jgi:hypothetical protein
VKEIFKTALLTDLDLESLFDLVRAKYAGHNLDYDLALQLVRINSKNFQVEFLRSNSPEPVLVQETGEIKEIYVGISPLISASANHLDKRSGVVATTSFAADTKIYLYSDGACEFVTKTGREFGLRRLTKTFASTQHGPWPDQLRSQLIAENRDTYFPDDVTVIRIQWGETLRKTLV